MPRNEGMATLEPLRGQTLGMQAADAIRRLIATGRLAGGDHLIESRIAEQLGIRVPVCLQPTSQSLALSGGYSRSALPLVLVLEIPSRKHGLFSF